MVQEGLKSKRQWEEGELEPVVSDGEDVRSTTDGGQRGGTGGAGPLCHKAFGKQAAWPGREQVAPVAGETERRRVLVGQSP